MLELDAGPTFASIREPIGSTDTAGELLQRLSVSGADLLVRTLDGIEDGTLVAQPQPESDQVSYAAKINVGRRPDRLESTGRRDRPVDPRLHPRSRGVDHVPG